ncbi:MAG: leucine-rich repeat domain-containing protein [Phycisphaerae bacterium]|nr:leucine-rich repeat domain-containing protein [Phycisphaerae bacterium]
MSAGHEASICSLVSLLLAAAIGGTGLGAGAGQMAGGDFSIVVKPDGTAWAWGYNADGELGNGATVSSPVPVQVGKTVWAGRKVVAVASGLCHTLAIVDNGDGTSSIYGWGDDSHSQIAHGGIDSSTPVLISDSTWSGKEVLAVACGDYHSLVLLTDNGATEVWAWGRNVSGQLGLGVFSLAVSTPTRITGLDARTITSIAAGADYSLALDDGGLVYTWGNNSHGQLGDGSHTDRSVPQSMAGLSGIDGVGAGGDFCVAWSLRTNTAWAWGRNDRGQLCLGNDTTDKLTPVYVADLDVIGTITDIRAGQSHAIALIAGGVYAWGDNTAGKLALPSDSTPYRSTPVEVMGGWSEVAAIGVGKDHSFVRDANGLVWTWGSNTYGQLGTGNAGTLVTAESLGLSDIKDVPAAGGKHNLVLVTDATDGKKKVQSWGDNACGQLGIGPAPSVVSAPVLTAPEQEADSVAAGDNHSLALFKSRVWAWGDNTYGQLGLGTHVGVDTPTAIAGLSAQTIVSIAAGADYSVAVDDSGLVYTWGDNSHGQLGDPSRADGSIPQSIASLFGVEGVAAGADFCFVWSTATNAVWAWGNNDHGQLCLGNTTNEPACVSVTELPALGTITDIHAGQSHALALVEGVVYAWGNNAAGQLGLPNSTAHRTTPIPVSNLPSDIVKIAAGSNHSLAIDSTGRLYGWGDNSSGQLGAGVLVVETPREIALPSGTIAADVAAGSELTLVLADTGEVFVFGNWLGHSDDTGVDSVHSFPASLELAVNPAEGGTIDVTRGQIFFGETIEVAVTPSDPYRLDSWTGSAVTAGLVDANAPEVVSFPIDRDGYTLQANLINTCTLTIQVQGHGTVVPAAGSHSYVIGTTIFCTAKPDPDYHVMWQSTCPIAGQETSKTVSFEITGDCTLTAVFDVNMPTFVDPNLKDAVAATLGVAEPNVIDMSNLTKLIATGNGIVDLTGLESATNLTWLDLKTNRITDISPLSQLTKLKVLNLRDNPLADSAFPQISGLTSLLELVLRNTNDSVQDVPNAWPTSLTRLVNLDLRGNDGLRLSDTHVGLMKTICVSNGGTLAVD